MGAVKSRIRLVSRILRWMDRQKSLRASYGITPYQALLFQTNEEYKIKHPYRPQ